MLKSPQRVGIGFGLAAAVGIPAGFAIGRLKFFSRMCNPLISALRPVSPLAWLPIVLLVFEAAHPAAIWTICTCFNVTDLAITERLATCEGSEDERLTALQASLRCGTNCGSCVPELKRLVRATPALLPA